MYANHSVGARRRSSRRRWNAPSRRGGSNDIDISGRQLDANDSIELPYWETTARDIL